MENKPAPSPTCTLKVKIKCCDKCPKKLEKKLLRTNGVESVAIDSEQELVTVVGNIDHKLLIEMFEKMGKKAELWSFQKEPLPLQQGKKENGDFYNDNVSKNSSKTKTWKSNGSRRESKSSSSDHHHHDVFGKRNNPPFSSPPTPTKRFFPRIPRPPVSPLYINPAKLVRPVNMHMADYYQLPPPPPPGAYGYNLWSRSPPKYNPMIHYSNYFDNYYSRV